MGSWHNKLSVHHAPPLQRPESAGGVRLLYRLTVKGEPTASLPRRTDGEWIARHIPLAYTTPPELLA